MTTKDYTYLLNKPYSVTDKHTAELEGILAEFPYLQSARAIYLKALYNKDSFRYNGELKKTAAYTADRAVLFDFITSEEFRGIDVKQLDKQKEAVSAIPVADIEIVAPALTISTPAPTIIIENPEKKLEDSIKLSIKEAEPEVEEKTVPAEVPEATAPVTETALPEQGTPLQFDQAEKHSFAEWLQLSKAKPVDRTQNPEKQVETTAAPSPEIEKKLDMIDSFIRANPKITPVKTDTSSWENLGKKTTEAPGLMTETLARVYLEQKKYSKAIQAYEILILKYPEKSAYFADLISEIKDLQ
ncbi:hypothetical protein ACLI09_16645 [Flavobacterium sp. RHBU_24]|uniref:tetratricopeptide repeat protein n=1 Tax=Flavobacterium sp. RHBU_24 TaxID=3391185 RepID=UPI00398502AB